MKRILLFLILTYNISYAQNLISNNSFESGSNSKPNGAGQLNECNNWVSLTTGTGPCGDSGGSSPDWFKSTEPFYRIIDANSSNISAHSGSAYVATAGNLEIIQQKLPNKLQPGLHLLKMFVKQSPINSPVPCTLPNPPPLPGNTQCFAFHVCGAKPHTGLNIFLSKNKIEYLDLNASNTKKNNLQPTITMNLPTTEMTDWVEVKIEVMVREEDVEWIGIEGVNTNEQNVVSYYTLIDDVSLEKRSLAQCKACGTNASAINVSIGNLNLPNPLRFIGLDNVTDFELKVYRGTLPTDLPARTIFLKNPRCIFQFNHKYDSGDPFIVATNSTYIIRASNDCDYKKYTFNSSNDVNQSNMPQNSYITGEQSSTKLNPLDNCCKDQLNLTGGTNIGGTFLSNECAYLDQYLGSSPPLPKLIFKARKSILVNSINSLKNTDLISPTIVLDGTVSNTSMTILEGTFIARNDCPPPPILLQKPNDSNTADINYTTSSKDDTVILTDDSNNIKNKNYVFNLYPNPTLGKFNLIIDGSDGSISYDINISDLQGKTVYTNIGYVNVNKDIDLSLLAKGMYFIKVIIGDKVFFQKVSKI